MRFVLPWAASIALAVFCMVGCSDTGPSDDEVRSRVLGSLREQGVDANGAACVADHLDASGDLDEVRDIILDDADDDPVAAEFEEAFAALADGAEACGVNFDSPAGAP